MYKCFRRLFGCQFWFCCRSCFGKFPLKPATVIQSPRCSRKVGSLLNILGRHFVKGILHRANFHELYNVPFRPCSNNAKAKFRCPRNTSNSKCMEKLWKPQIHCIACHCSGVAEGHSVDTVVVTRAGSTTTKRVGPPPAWGMRMGASGAGGPPPRVEGSCMSVLLKVVDVESAPSP